MKADVIRLRMDLEANGGRPLGSAQRRGHYKISPWSPSEATIQ